MGKLKEVKEYDSITGNIDYKDDDKYEYVPEPVFSELIEFIHEFAGNEENADALDFMRISYKRNVGDLVSIKNFVGLIQMKSGYQIQVLPKIDFGTEEDDSNTKTKKVFLKMLKSMKDFPSKTFNAASLKVDKMNLYEIFINMYLQEVRQLVKHGIKSTYITKEDNLNYYKGKLLINQHIKTNIVHKEKFFVAFDEFNPNRAENKLVKATLLKLQKMTSSAENSKEIRQLLTAFEMIDVSTNYEKDFACVHIDRNTKDYEMLMKWSKVFLMNKSFSTFSGDTYSRALLFPMEKFFESYVAQKMKKIFSPGGWEVKSQAHGFFLFVEPRKQFALRPDIVLQKGNRTVIMDTKWKNLIDNESKNYGISQQDMYQMYAYSKKYATSEIWLLYPLNRLMREHAPIVFDSGDNTTVSIHFIDLDNIEENLEQLKDKLEMNAIYENLGGEAIG
ncbi:McrC family protein [Pseudobutyrivibrio ruminis]|uniref:5-methylcytosine-specific restriction enzyme subunit McrC n=1 Tax=Pseudobutyrivibrio ruminis DSM 9787 TaxID=1123011 RepID=A0A285RR32_9FIRM|nr:McrC family protein [Pseudobutyrivibrio ruminis]SOB96566.1 5-methylcytosine-specific restriction enzyme subunit McrC [Pseudobutyrivibrio ruminis DSM 9787]